MNSLAKICKDLVFDQPFYGLLLLNLQKEWSQKIPTAGVGINGINYKLVINPEFWQSLNMDQKRGLIMHELQHIAFFHITDFKHLKNNEIANIAKDIEINQNIPESWLPSGGCFLKDFKDQYNLLPHEGTNKYYEKLLQKHEEEQQCGGGGLVEQILSSLTESQSTGNEPNPVDLPSGGQIKPGKHYWGEAETMSEAQKTIMDRQLASMLQEVIEQVKKSQGNIPHNVEQVVKRILTLEPPKFNWKAYLRRFIGNSIKTSVRKTKRKKSKRFKHDFGIRIHEHSHILLGIDSSASVSDKEIKEFLGEIRHMHKSGHEFTLIFADTQMQEPIKYSPHKDLVIKKRGGTSFDPIVDYYHQHRNKYSTLIYLTDGEAPVPNNPVKNMLWVLSTISSDADHLKASSKVIKLN